MKKMLVVVDMQHDFIDGTLGSVRAQEIVPRVAEKIREYRQRGDIICFTMDTHHGDYLSTQEGEKLPVEHCIKNTSGWQLHEQTTAEAALEQCRIYEKGAFGSKEYAHDLEDGLCEKLGIGEIELIGLCTDICVISNAMLTKAFAPEIPVKVDASCCAGVTQKSHQTALDAMSACQIEITGA